MKNAIIKAIEGGYQKLYGYRDFKESDNTLCEADDFGIINNHFLLDPLFWQCLGKAEKWVDTKYKQSVGPVFTGRPVAKIHRQDWKVKWHKFIDHLAGGKEVNLFFDNLLK